MSQKIISLCYRKIIDLNAIKVWDKIFFESSYLEFRIQAQSFGGGKELTSYGALLQRFPSAQQLAGRVTPAVAGYIQQLEGIMPDQLNNIGKRFIPFESFVFEIINSDIDDKAKHQVAVNFFSGPMIWQDTIGNHLLLSGLNPDENGTYQTNLYQLQPYVNINTLKQ